MRAVRIEQFGGIDTIHLTTQPSPEPNTEEVQVRVRAASLNPIDSKVRSGAMRLMSGSHFPMPLGSDFSGVIEAVGPGVSDLKVGDEVFGAMSKMSGGAFAEVIVTSKNSVTNKPASISFEEAAAVPIAGIAALVGLRDIAHTAPGMQVLINGCTGGVGLFALQIARMLGAHVVGACSEAGFKLANQLGAHEVFDYRSDALTKQSHRFDIIFEMSGHLSYADAKSLMTPHGIFVDPAPTPSVIVGAAMLNPFRGQKRKPLLSKSNAVDLTWLANELEAKRLSSIVAKAFPLEEIQAATKLSECGGVLGKIVLRIS
jgi:NADPH:quinone reductase-like Zn-dependent oxidoreductase